MTSKLIRFFATPGDLRPVLEAVEQARPLHYVTRKFDASPEALRSESLAQELSLGRATAPASINSVAYLAADRGQIIQPKAVPQKAEGIFYAWNQEVNPHTVIVRPGGIWEEAKAVMVGDVSTIGEQSEDLFKLFAKHIRKAFKKVKASYVGPEASRLREEGWRLTHAVATPTMYDLRAD